MQDHAPYAHAFDELALLVFLELLEESARYLDALSRADDVDEICCGDGREDNSDQEGDSPDGNPGAPADADVLEDDPGPGHETQPLNERYFRLALAAGYVLRAKADGWKLFCERLAIPPFALWEHLPGFARLRQALARGGTDSFPGAAFTPEGFLRWVNEARPGGGAGTDQGPIHGRGPGRRARGPVPL